MPGNSTLIFGIAGQDGRLMTEYLAAQGCKVTGLLRPEDLGGPTIPGLRALGARLVEGDIEDKALQERLIGDEKPDHIYNFAGLSFVPYSWEHPYETARVNGAAVGAMLDVIHRRSPGSRFFQACSSEMFGVNPKESPQDEKTPFAPANPYASAKALAAHLVRNYRERFGVFACAGILYNHESPWRGPDFVTRKITIAVAAIKLGRAESVRLGDLEARRDWSYAGDFVRGMRMTLDSDTPRDYVFASGSVHSVRDVVETAFGHVGLEWRRFVTVDPRLVRPNEPKPLCGNPGRAQRELGWRPHVGFEELIHIMTDHDLAILQG